MKIRNGFVSNSSSSSFVVAFPKKPKTVKDVREMLFGKDEFFPVYYPHEDEDANILTEKIAETVFNDIKAQRPNNRNKIVEGFEGWLDGAPKFPDYDSNMPVKERNISWEKHDRECTSYRNKVAKKFMKENADCFIYTFEYGDEDGRFYATMEHGGIFDKVVHMRISRH